MLTYLNIYSFNFFFLMYTLSPLKLAVIADSPHILSLV